MEIVLAVVVLTLALGYSAWFLAGMVRHVKSGGYENDQRILDVLPKG
jgi:hypothetical protein